MRSALRPAVTRIPHRSVSGDLARCWEYDPGRRAIILVVDGRGTDIPVAVTANPRHAAYMIRPLEDSEWELLPSVFERHGAFWSNYIADYPDRALPAMAVLLTHAPPHVATEMAELFFETCPEPDPE